MLAILSFCGLILRQHPEALAGLYLFIINDQIYHACAKTSTISGV